MIARIVAVFVGIFALASAQGTFTGGQDQQRTMQPRSNFGANANVGLSDGFGFNAGVQVGNPLQSNFLFPIIIGLGMLSLINIVLTVFLPLLKKKDTATDEAAADARNARHMDMESVVDLATTVMQALQHGYELNDNN